MDPGYSGNSLAAIFPEVSAKRNPGPRVSSAPVERRTGQVRGAKASAALAAVNFR